MKPLMVQLLASAARTTNGDSGWILLPAWAKRVHVFRKITASAADAGDTMDNYVDFSPDGTIVMNGGHFTQQAGNGAANVKAMVFSDANPGTSEFDVTSDAAAAAVRPYMTGKYIRARHVIVDTGDHDQSHTFQMWAMVYPV